MDELRDMSQVRGISGDAFAVMRNAENRYRSVCRESSKANERRDRVYAFIESYMMEHGGVAPLLREISSALGITIGMAHEDVRKLEEHGRLQRRKNGERGLRLTAHVKAPWCPFCKQKVRR